MCPNNVCTIMLQKPLIDTTKSNAITNFGHVSIAFRYGLSVYTMTIFVNAFHNFYRL